MSGPAASRLPSSLIGDEDDELPREIEQALESLKEPDDIEAAKASITGLKLTVRKVGA